MSVDLDVIEIPQEIAESGSAAVERYLEWCFKNGSPPADDEQVAFAVMFARRRAPGTTGTERDNHRGGAMNPFPGMAEPIRQHYLKQCRKQGINPTGKIYKSSLVRREFQGRLDPEAFVSDTSDCLKKLKERGWSSDGTIGYQAPEREVDERLNDTNYQVSDSIVDEHVANEVIENHGGRIKKRDYSDLRAKVKARLQGAA